MGSFATVRDRKLVHVLERLVNLEPKELSNEAKVEKCRATRDLRSCGREVQYMLMPCRHASLCAECSQRCDVCPVCRVPIAKQNLKSQLRLFDECLDAGLISSKDEDCKDKDGYLCIVDVQRLWSFFDVAIENNLTSVICYYVTDVCMDENAVSSDAVLSMLLDGAVVKEWCKRTFSIIVRTLRDIYTMGLKQMHNKLDQLYKLSEKLLGIVNVLGALDIPQYDSSSAPAIELHQLQEALQRVHQHSGVMAWCARHQFLENIQSRHASINHWRTTMRERKSAAQDRAWPDYLIDTGKLGSKPPASLFIEDAILNLIPGKDSEEDLYRDISELGYLRQGNVSSSPSYRCRREWAAGQHGSGVLYPPESVWSTVDTLFLEGSSDLYLAKKAIFLYYLFDRHWTLPDSGWKWVVEDYTATFDIPKHALHESLVFFLLDDHTEQALEDACKFLPEAVTTTVHPKIARVLLERHKPDAALWVLRCSGKSSRQASENVDLTSLSEAVTAVRVRLECGLLTEAFLYQRMHVAKLKGEEYVSMKSKKNRHNTGEEILSRSWLSEMEVLVGEICWFCIYRNLLDRMVELPWQFEEDTVRKCLLERAAQDPACNAGSIMVVYYLQRCRYVEAYLVHKRLCNLEEQFASQSDDEKKVSHVRFASQQRTCLVEKSIELLSEAQRHELMSGLVDKILTDPLSGTSPIVSIKEINVDHLEALGQMRSKRPICSPPSTSPFLSSSNKPISQLINLETPRSEWNGFQQPSILHGRAFKSSLKGTSPLHASNSSICNNLQAYTAFSPMLSRRLKYDEGSTMVSQGADQPAFPLVQKVSFAEDTINSDNQRHKVVDIGNSVASRESSELQHSSYKRPSAGAEMSWARVVRNAGFHSHIEADPLNKGQGVAQLDGSHLSSAPFSDLASNIMPRNDENGMDHGQEIMASANHSGPFKRQQNQIRSNVLTNMGVFRAQSMDLSLNGKSKVLGPSLLDYDASAKTSQRVEQGNSSSPRMQEGLLCSFGVSDDHHQRMYKPVAQIVETRPKGNDGNRWREDDDYADDAEAVNGRFSGTLKYTRRPGRSTGRSYLKSHVI